MIIKTNSTDLENALVALNKVNNKVTSPILDNVLFEVTPDSVKLTTSNTDKSIRVTAALLAEIDGEEELVCLINSKSLLAAVKAMPSQDIEINLTDTECSIKHTTGIVSIECDNLSDKALFPRAKEIAESTSVICAKYQQLIDTMKSCATCATCAEVTLVRPVLQGVYVEFLAGVGFRVNGTDGRIICRKVVAEEITDNIKPIIIPAPAIPVLSAVKGEYAKITISNDNRLAEINVASQMLIQIDCIEGDYPNVDSVVGRATNRTDNKVVINKKNLLTSINRLSNFSGSSQLLVCTISAQGLALVGRDEDNGVGATEMLAVETQIEEPVKIGLSAELLKKAINLVQDESVIIRVSASANPVLICENDTEILVSPMAFENK